jgi:hypothetical protein
MVEKELLWVLGVPSTEFILSMAEGTQDRLARELGPLHWTKVQ